LWTLEVDGLIELVAGVFLFAIGAALLVRGIRECVFRRFMHIDSVILPGWWTQEKRERRYQEWQRYARIWMPGMFLLVGSVMFIQGILEAT
jgi:hypothetical protein